MIKGHAQQGLKPEVEENSDPIAEEEDREKKIAASAAGGLRVAPFLVAAVVAGI